MTPYGTKRELKRQGLHERREEILRSEEGQPKRKGVISRWFGKLKRKNSERATKLKSWWTKKKSAMSDYLNDKLEQQKKRDEEWWDKTKWNPENRKEQKPE